MKKLSASILALAICLPSLSYGQEIGTLFTTAEEREYLDYLREEFLASKADAGFNIDEDVIPEIPEDEDEPQENVEFYFGGIMTRAAGGKAVWLNGNSILENDLPANVRIVRVDGKDALRLETSEARFVLKPGQTVNISTGEFWEAFERPRSLPREESQESEEGGVNQELSGSSGSAAAEDLPATAPSAETDLPAEIDMSEIPPEVLDLIPSADVQN